MFTYPSSNFSNQLKYLYLVTTSREVNEFSYFFSDGSELCSKDKYQECAVENVKHGASTITTTSVRQKNANSMSPDQINKRGVIIRK